MGHMLTVEQTAKMLQLNPQVVRQYLREGKLPGTKVGRHWRVVEEELVRFMRPSGNESSVMLDAWNQKAREWRTLSQEQKMRRLDEIVGKYSEASFSSEDLVREHREEVERDEQRLHSGAEEEHGFLLRQWESLSLEDRLKIIDEVQGSLADMSFSSDDLIRERREETEREEERFN